MAETLLKLPGVGQFVSSNEQLSTHFKKQAQAAGQANNSTSSATYYAAQKLKGTQEVIVHICKQLQARVQECNQMTQEFKRMEKEIQQLQIERSNILQSNPNIIAQQQQQQFVQHQQHKQRQSSSSSKQSQNQPPMPQSMGQPSFQQVVPQQQ